METPEDISHPAVRTIHGARLGFSGRVIRWAYLLTVGALAFVLAAAAELIPATALADRGGLGVGSLAGFNIVVVLIGLVSAPLGGFRSVARRWPTLLLLLALNVVGFAIFPPTWALHFLQTEQTVFFVLDAEDRFALTIDDGLDPATTPRILETLSRHDARATFFVLAETLQENGPLVRRLLAEGHELGNHQWTDTPAISLRPDRFESEVERANAAITAFAVPRWFRPGGGAPPGGAAQLVDGLGLRIALGSVFPFDSHIPWTPLLCAHVEGRTRAGSIVVLHDRGDRGLRTAAVLDRVLPRLKQRGLHATTLSELAR